MIDWEKIPLPECKGNRSCYVRGCGSDVCTAANTEYIREYRARKKAEAA